MTSVCYEQLSVAILLERARGEVSWVRKRRLRCCECFRSVETTTSCLRAGQSLARRAGLELFPAGKQRKPALLDKKAELGSKVRDSAVKLKTLLEFFRNDTELRRDL